MKIKILATILIAVTSAYNCAGNSQDDLASSALLLALQGENVHTHDFEEHHSPFALTTTDKTTLKEKSVLSKINKAGSLAVCVQFKGYDTVNPVRQLAIQTVITQAINAWNKELFGLYSHPWPYFAVVVTFPNALTPLKDCSAGPNSIAVYIDKSVPRSFASMWSASTSLTGEFMLNPDNYVEKNGKKSSAYRLVAHEYGHLIGLGDAYTEAGYQQPIGQPQGIMNYLWGVKDLSFDDQAAIRQLWTYMNSDVEVCGPDYQVGGSNENSHNNTFCVPTGYRLTNLWQGSAKSLDIVGDSAKDKLQMANSGNYTGQIWYMQKSKNGNYYKLRTKYSGEYKCLDIVAGGLNNKLHMTNCGNWSGQLWKAEDIGNGYFRLKTMFTGNNKCLDVNNDGGNNSQLHMTNCGNWSGQYWKRQNF